MDNTLPGPEGFFRVMERTIQLVGQKVDNKDLKEVAQVFRSLCWDFPDYALKVYFLVDGEGQVSYSDAIPGTPDANITMNARTFHDCAFGKTSFGIAFITGKLRVQGIQALKLGKFMPLLNPFLESYQQAWAEQHE